MENSLHLINPKCLQTVKLIDYSKNKVFYKSKLVTKDDEVQELWWFCKFLNWFKSEKNKYKPKIKTFEDSYLIKFFENHKTLHSFTIGEKAFIAEEGEIEKIKHCIKELNNSYTSKKQKYYYDEEFNTIHRYSVAIIKTSYNTSNIHYYYKPEEFKYITEYLTQNFENVLFKGYENL